VSIERLTEKRGRHIWPIHRKKGRENLVLDTEKGFRYRKRAPSDRFFLVNRKGVCGKSSLAAYKEGMALTLTHLQEGNRPKHSGGKRKKDLCNGSERVKRPWMDLGEKGFLARHKERGKRERQGQKKGLFSGRFVILNSKRGQSKKSCPAAFFL